MAFEDFKNSVYRVKRPLSAAIPQETGVPRIAPPSAATAPRPDHNVPRLKPPAQIPAQQQAGGNLLLDLGNRVGVLQRDLLNNPMRYLGERAPQTSNLGQRYRLMASGAYTPQAEYAQWNLPTTTRELPGARMAYAPDANTLVQRPDYFQPGTFKQEMATNDYTHELSHYFDTLNPQSSNPEFQQAVRESDARYFPGMGIKPAMEIWGGEAHAPAEAYAYIGQNPGYFKNQFARFYPQYAAQAFQMPQWQGPAGEWMRQDATWPFVPPTGTPEPNVPQKIWYRG